MNLIQRRRAKPDHAEQRKAQEEVRRQIAMAVSIAEKKAKAEVQTDVMEALAMVAGKSTK